MFFELLHLNSIIHFLRVPTKNCGRKANLKKFFLGWLHTGIGKINACLSTSSLKTYARQEVLVTHLSTILGCWLQPVKNWRLRMEPSNSFPGQNSQSKERFLRGKVKHGNRGEETETWKVTVPQSLIVMEFLQRKGSVSAWHSQQNMQESHPGKGLQLQHIWPQRTALCIGTLTRWRSREGMQSKGKGIYFQEGIRKILPFLWERAYIWIPNMHLKGWAWVGLCHSILKVQGQPSLRWCCQA